MREHCVIMTVKEIIYINYFQSNQYADNKRCLDENCLPKTFSLSAPTTTSLSSAENNNFPEVVST